VGGLLAFDERIGRAFANVAFVVVAVLHAML